MGSVGVGQLDEYPARSSARARHRESDQPVRHSMWQTAALCLIFGIQTTARQRVGHMRQHKTLADIMTTPSMKLAETWEQTLLWEELCARRNEESDSVCTFLKGWLPEIERVLKSGGTAPLDFTLHDEEHAFRVSQRMVDIIPEDVLPNLSDYEIALLLLSAYLHDIGMTPERRKVQLHHQLLLTGRRGEEQSPGGGAISREKCLSEQEVGEFQRWLDDNQRGTAIPIAAGPLSPGDLALAEELVAHYCRHRHNDWSEEWIRAHGPTGIMATYADWQDDLTCLCRSHHHEMDELLREHFAPRDVGTPARTVHLRYLACVLRVADVLEFDPERTPDVVMRHRSVSKGSLIYWHKDKGIAFACEGGRFRITARPDNARLHRAIEDLADAIDRELGCCCTLDDMTKFRNCPWREEDLPHHWEFEAKLHRDIRPRENTYVYIDGTFRPNTQKLLELFSGMELYGSEMVAVREIVQNAFDAIKEQIARERLELPNPEDVSLEQSLGSLHSVQVRILERGDGLWLVCRDDGIGMTKEIISKYVLVSGSARRHDILELERACNSAGFALNRTGQFGIGVLSYFMLADTIVFYTCRSRNARDAEPNGWRFETDGIGGFGELRADNSMIRGTKLEIRLKPELLNKREVWFSDLRLFARETIRHVPCRLTIDLGDGKGEIDLSPGWTAPLRETLETCLLPKPETHPVFATTLSERDIGEFGMARRAEVVRQCNELGAKISQSLRFVTSDLSLEGGAGRVRLTLPYFELSGGESLAFFDEVPGAGELLTNALYGAHGWKPPLKTIASWRGMSVELGTEAQRRMGRHHLTSMALIEVDFHSASVGSLSLDRQELHLSGRWEAIAAAIEEECLRLQIVAAQRSGGSHYRATNEAMMEWTGKASNAVPNAAMWPTNVLSKGVSVFTWEDISFPVGVSLWDYRGPEESPLRTWRLGTTLVREIPGLLLAEDLSESFSAFMAHDSFRGPDLITCDNSDRVPVAVWWRDPFTTTSNETWFRDCEYPRSWSNVLGFVRSLYGDSVPVWNRKHPVYLAASRSPVFADRNLLLSHVESDVRADASEEDRCAWLLGYIAFTGKLGNRERATLLWKGLQSGSPGVIPSIWFDLKLPTRRNPLGEQILLTDGGTVRLSPNKWNQRWLGENELLLPKVSNGQLHLMRTHHQSARQAASRT